MSDPFSRVGLIVGIGVTGATVTEVVVVNVVEVVVVLCAELVGVTEGDKEGS